MCVHVYMCVLVCLYVFLNITCISYTPTNLPDILMKLFKNFSGASLSPFLFCLLPVVRAVIVVVRVVVVIVVIKISKQSGNNSHTFAPAATQLILLNIHEQNEARSR